MSNYYYTKTKKLSLRRYVRIASGIVSLSGLLVILYIFLPFLSWQLYFTPVFASSDLTSPIPKNTILNPSLIRSLVAQTTSPFSSRDYTRAENWFPDYQPKNPSSNRTVHSYTLSIPAIHIKDAVVSTQDTNLSEHLVNYIGTAIPPEKGNAVIFGHSTLPQLFNPNDYKTILANAYKLKVGNTVITEVNTVAYTYSIESITVVDPSDTSVLAQEYNDSYLTLITCTPPGTTWKRLIIRARIQKIQE